MLFRHLSQRSSGNLLTIIEGYLVSIVGHVIVIGSFFMPTTRPVVTELPESFEWAKFLLPVERPKGNPQVPGEHITYFTPAAAPGGAGTELTDQKEPERVELVVPEGTRADDMVGASVPPPPQEETKGDEVMTVLEVDSAATRVEDGAAPPYPPGMLAKRIEGSVAVQYVVDTTGRADTTSFIVLQATHPDFAKSVKQTLPLFRFRAAKMNETKVRQLVQQLFSFKIDTTLLTPPPRKP